MLMTEWNWDDALAVRYDEGMERGMERGMAQGMEQKSIDIARKMRNMNLSIEQIAEGTGLSMETIQKL